MNRSGWRSRLVALLTALIAGVGLLSLSTAPTWAAAGTVTEFNVPSGTAFGITAGPDGNLWFAAPDVNAIGRITTTGSFTQFPLPTTCGSSAGCGPYAITAGPDGNLWFTEAANDVGRITPTGSFTQFRVGGVCVANEGCEAFGITSGPDGNLWFTEGLAGGIGRITKSSRVSAIGGRRA